MQVERGGGHGHGDACGGLLGGTIIDVVDGLGGGRGLRVVVGALDFAGRGGRGGALLALHNFLVVAAEASVAELSVGSVAKSGA